MRNSRYWMGLTDWFISSTGDREATGADSGHPITEYERQQRMGPRPTWNPGAYHLHYLDDQDSVYLTGDRRPGNAIFCHGAAVAGEGKTAGRFTGTATTVVPVARDGTNQALEVTSASIPTSWAASGLENTSGVYKRVRMTSGATGAVWYPMKDLGTKTIRGSEINAAATFVYPFPLANQGAGTTTISNGDTFVVEDLVRLKRVVVATSPAFDSGTPGVTSGPICIESVRIGEDGFTGTASDAIVCFGSVIHGTSGNRRNGLIAWLKIHGCLGGDGLLPTANFVQISGFAIGASTSGDFSFIAINGGRCRRLFTQGRNTKWTGVSGSLDDGWHVEHFGAFDVASQAIDIMSPGGFIFWADLSGAEGASRIWGKNNATAISIRPTTSMLYLNTLSAAQFPIEATNDIVMGRTSRTSVEVWNEATRSYTNPRALTFESIVDVITSGTGFCQAGMAGSPLIIDPLSNCKIARDQF